MGITAGAEGWLDVAVTVKLFAGVDGASFDQTRLTEDQVLMAMSHLDTNGNQEYDFVTTNGQEDGPYIEDGSAVVDKACITISC